MIFVTVGAQMPFDRLVRAMDDWAASHRQRPVFAQIGPTEYRPRSLEWSSFLDPPEFRRRVAEAELLVAHAGMGSIITALELGKPILVMPRRGDLRETRNDHQVATAKRFLEQGRVSVAFDERELPERLDSMTSHDASDRIAATADPRLIGALRQFIFDSEKAISS
ncbi:MAG: glycosyltransferase [Phycisphaerales bacterium]